jgi:hypothetical protein
MLVVRRAIIYAFLLNAVAALLCASIYAQTRPLKILEKPVPVTPSDRLASIGHVQRTITLKVEFLSSAEIGEVIAIAKLPYGLTEDAMEAARKIKFEPKMVDGKPKSVKITVQYEFSESSGGWYRIPRIRAQVIDIDPKRKPMNFEDVADELFYWSNSGKNYEQMNQVLSEEIRTLGIDFVLLDEDREVFTRAGASSELINVINEAIPENSKSRLRLERIIGKNYAGKVEQIKLAVKAGKEYLQKYNNDKDAQPYVQWLNLYLPRLEQWIKNMEEDR